MSASTDLDISEQIRHIQRGGESAVDQAIQKLLGSERLKTFQTVLVKLTDVMDEDLTSRYVQHYRYCEVCRAYGRKVPAADNPPPVEHMPDCVGAAMLKLFGYTETVFRRDRFLEAAINADKQKA